MISGKVATQQEVDKMLYEEFGISPLGQFTSDGTQQLYQDANGKAHTFPASVEGYSAYSVEDMRGHVKRVMSGAKVVGIHQFEAVNTSS